MAEIKAIPAIAKLTTYNEVKAIVQGYDEGKAEERKIMEEFVDVMNEFNGAYDGAAAGVGASYIPVSTYFHIGVVTADEKTSIADGKQCEIIELFYNWRALGKNKAALYGASIRFGARHLVDLSREVVELKANRIPQTMRGDFEAFKLLLAREKLNAAIWSKQYHSIIAMNGACLVAISHHWDSENLRPWNALVQSLGQADVVDESMYRTMFYLALHPIPLRTVEMMRAQAADGKHTQYVNAVSIRARCTPATTGAMMVCAAAVPDLKGEPWAVEVKGRLLQSVDALAVGANAIRLNPAAYCPLASAFGKDRLVVDIGAYKTVMLILTAYILECVKGTLARSASLRKFQNTNARAVTKWRGLLATADQAAAGTLEEELRKLAA